MTEFLAPIRPITSGPAYHWFGYYDKREFDVSGRFVLGMEVGFEGRSPGPDDVIGIGIVDLEDGDRWIPLGTSRAWCWQQGCMLQWVPGDRDEIIWNDRVGDRFVSRILRPGSQSARTLPAPIYAVSPDGSTAVSLEFARVNDMRPGYGYAGLADPNRERLAPDDAGIWRVDLASGRRELIVCLAQVASIPYPHSDLSLAKHYFNHLLIDPSGRRFVLLHRWRFGDGPFATRMVTAGLDGSNLRVLDDSGHTSHFCWRDASHVLAFTRPNGKRPGFYLFDDVTGSTALAMDDPVDGHCLYLPGNEWISCDTYPKGERRERELYLYHMASGARRTLGTFASPAEYAGELRCDLHPRHGPAGEKLVIDSVHGGQGRQMYLLDIRAALAADLSSTDMV